MEDGLERVEGRGKRMWSMCVCIRIYSFRTVHTISAIIVVQGFVPEMERKEITRGK